jgi:hypothetical protein
LNFDLRIDFGHHPIGRLLDLPAEPDRELGGDGTIHEFFNENQPNLAPFLNGLPPDSTSFITSHNYPIRPVDDDCRGFLKSILTPRPDYQRHLATIERTLAMGSQYAVIHIRTGDLSATFANQQYNVTSSDSCVDGIVNRLRAYIITHVTPAWGDNVLIVSDNSLVSDRVSCEHGLKKLRGTPVHLGWLANEEDVQHTLTEFLLMTRSSAIYQWSVYEWSSGFSQMVSTVYGTPLYRID